MDSTATYQLLSAANGATALLGRLNLAELPALAALQVSSNHRDGWKIGVTGQLLAYGLSELEQIDAIRAWAVALDGWLRIDGKDFHDARGSSRHLAAVAELPNGSHFEVWVFLAGASAPAADLAAV